MIKLFTFTFFSLVLSGCITSWGVDEELQQPVILDTKVNKIIVKELRGNKHINTISEPSKLSKLAEVWNSQTIVKDAIEPQFTYLLSINSPGYAEGIYKYDPHGYIKHVGPTPHYIFYLNNSKKVKEILIPQPKEATDSGTPSQ